MLIMENCVYLEQQTLFNMKTEVNGIKINNYSIDKL